MFTTVRAASAQSGKHALQHDGKHAFFAGLSAVIRAALSLDAQTMSSSKIARADHQSRGSTVSTTGGEQLLPHASHPSSKGCVRNRCSIREFALPPLTTFGATGDDLLSAHHAPEHRRAGADPATGEQLVRQAHRQLQQRRRKEV